MRKIYLLISLLIIFTIIGCGDRRKEMKERFKPYKSYTLIDTDGKKYVIRHFIMNIYKIDPLDSKINR